MMKVFVWKEVEKCSSSYHSEGGVVVFAETEERARELANSHSGCAIREDEMPCDVRTTSGNEAVYIMENAGCC
jgi:hypothetical protein